MIVLCENAEKTIGKFMKLERNMSIGNMFVGVKNLVANGLIRTMVLDFSSNLHRSSNTINFMEHIL